MANKITGADWLLILLYVDNQSSIKGTIRLTKMMFIFQQEILKRLNLNKNMISEENLQHFIAYKFGPFSKDLYEQIELFKNIKFIETKDLFEISNVDDTDLDLKDLDNLNENYFDEETFNTEGNEFINNTDKKFIEYKIAKAGKDFVDKELKFLISKKDLDLLEKFKRKIIELSINQILKYVYIKYPKFTEKSLIKEEVLNDNF